MHWTEFTLKLLEQLLWPSVFVIALIALRKPLLQLLPSLAKVKYKELELEFDRELQQAAKAATELLLHADASRTQLLQQAKISPSNAILEAWRLVEKHATEVIEGSGGNIPAGLDRPYKHMEDILIHERLIDTRTGKLFSDVRQLRNKVAHAKNFHTGQAEAVQYIDLCYQLIDHLKAL